MGKYHIYARELIDCEGKQSKIWYYWYRENDKRIRKPAAKEGNRAPHLKRQALEFIEYLERRDEEQKNDHPSPTRSVAAPLDAPRTFESSRVHRSLFYVSPTHCAELTS